MIRVLSRKYAEQLISNKKTQSEMFDGAPFALISISSVKNGLDPLHEKNNTMDTESDMLSLLSENPSKYISNVLTLSFLDIIPRDDRNDLDSYLMTEAQATQIIEFIEKNKDIPLVVHCTAGISRSGAVAAYAAIVRNEEESFWELHQHYIRPNVHVLNLLKKHLWESK